MSVAGLYRVTVMQPNRERFTPGFPVAVRFEERLRASTASVNTESIALIPECAECCAVWLPGDEERWRAYHTDDEPPELVFYCPECAERGVRPGLDRPA
jgi:hypothetical protein